MDRRRRDLHRDMFEVAKEFNANLLAVEMTKGQHIRAVFITSTKQKVSVFTSLTPSNRFNSQMERATARRILRSKQ